MHPILVQRIRRLCMCIYASIVVFCTISSPSFAEEPFAFYVYDGTKKEQLRLLNSADWFPENSPYLLLARPNEVVDHVVFQADCMSEPVLVKSPPFVVALPPKMNMCSIKAIGRTAREEPISAYSVVLSTHKDVKAVDESDMDWSKNDNIYGFAVVKDKYGNIQTAVSDIPEEIMGKVGAKQLKRRNRSMGSMASEYDFECKFIGNCKSNGPAEKTVTVGRYASLIRKSNGGLLADLSKGIFETTCTVSHYAYADPLRKSTATGSNLNMFWGNTVPPIGLAAVANNIPRKSTCRGGSEDMSSYWAPAMLDASGQIVEPSEIRVSYSVDTEHEDPERVYSIPAGFRMSTGFPNAIFPMGMGLGNFSCDNKLSAGIPICKKSDLEMQVNFLNCWNGVKEEGADVRLQLERAESMSGEPRPACPPTHPYVLPRITYTIVYSTPPEGTKGWRLSSDRYSSEKTKAGYSIYGGYVDGWNPSTKKVWMDNCVRNGMLCLKGKLGDDRQLVY